MWQLGAQVLWNPLRLRSTSFIHSHIKTQVLLLNTVPCAPNSSHAVVWWVQGTTWLGALVGCFGVPQNAQSKTTGSCLLDFHGSWGWSILHLTVWGSNIRTWWFPLVFGRTWATHWITMFVGHLGGSLTLKHPCLEMKQLGILWVGHYNLFVSVSLHASMSLSSWSQNMLCQDYLGWPWQGFPREVWTGQLFLNDHWRQPFSMTQWSKSAMPFHFVWDVWVFLWRPCLMAVKIITGGPAFEVTDLPHTWKTEKPLNQTMIAQKL